MLRRLTVHCEGGSGGFVLHFGSDVPCIWQDGVCDDQAVYSALTHNVVAAVVADLSPLVEPLGSGVVYVQLTLKDGSLALVDLLVLQGSDEFWW